MEADKLITPSLALGRKFELPDDDSSSATNNQSEKQPRVHAFVVGNLGLLLDTEKIISEVFNELQICRLPNTSPWLHGVANQRGNMVPIFDLEKILGFENDMHAENAKYLVFGQREQAVGILIYKLPIRLTLNHQERLSRTPEMPALLQPYIVNSYQKDAQIWLEWDIFSFFTSISEHIAA